MQKTKIHALTVIAGLLLAVAIICTHVFSFKQTAPENAKTEHSDDKNQSETIISASAISLPTSAHVHLNMITYCLFEITLSEEKEESSSCDFLLFPKKLLLTLFTVIISPNAP